MPVSARRLGPYAPLSATYASDDALIEAGEKAELLFVRILAFLSTSNSDGYFTDNQLTRYIGVGMRDAKARAARLVEVGKLERTEGGYVLRSWLKWNKSAEELGREKKKDRERKAKDSTPTPPSDGTGIQTDSERIPDGFQTDSEPHVRGGAEAREAGALPNHFTSLHSTSPPTPSDEGGEKPPKRTRATQPPDHFLVTSDLREWALARGIHADLERETERWLDHHRSKGNTMKDWTASWRTWMNGTLTFGSSRVARPPVNGKNAWATR